MSPMASVRELARGRLMAKSWMVVGGPGTGGRHVEGAALLCQVKGSASLDPLDLLKGF